MNNADLKAAALQQLDQLDAQLNEFQQQANVVLSHLSRVMADVAQLNVDVQTLHRTFNAAQLQAVIHASRLQVERELAYFERLEQQAESGPETPAEHKP